ncbi:MAG: hypothetical protein QNK04_10135 [Myxococcota bacterium]|nr:hypothetical protein [Myxococcota bacterium]
MDRPRATFLAALALPALLASPPPAGADRWVRDEEGLCHREWTPRSLARGPIAMANGLLLPFRSFYGGFTAGWQGAVLSPLGLFVGLAEGFGWLGIGAAELATGGAFGLAPEGAVHQIEVGPVVQMPLGRRTLDEYEVDRCDEQDLLAGSSTRSSGPG